MLASIPKRNWEPSSEMMIWTGDIAYDYLVAGMSVVPVKPSEKKPLVSWKRYQTQKTTLAEVDQWWTEFPHAGIACVLGPVSGVLAVDVDGPEAHATLIKRLGEEPAAPKVITGSRKPFRYQLLFRHPTGMATRAKFTPWHPALEFRGRGGLSILPPSTHPSGKRYRWAGRQPFDCNALPALPDAILAALERDAEARSNRPTDLAPSVVRPIDLDRVQRRALELLTKELRAVEGQGGDKTTWTAALYLVRDFALTPEQALPVLARWNETNCSPRWTEEQLTRKLLRALEEPGRRGRLVDLDGEVEPTSIRNESAATGTFFAPVPDHVLADWSRFDPCSRTQVRGRPAPWLEALLSLLRATAVLQRSSDVRLPAQAVAQLRWGGDESRWPSRWVSKLMESLRHRRGRVIATRRKCLEGCPLHHSDQLRHHDVKFRFKSPSDSLGVLHSFRIGASAKGVARYDYKGGKSHHPAPGVAAAATKTIRAAKKIGTLCSVYLPAWVVGPLVFAPGPCRVLQSLTRELTRDCSRSAARTDTAEVVEGSIDPHLDPRNSYVRFDGNGSRGRAKYHGRGYRLGERMKRAGYPAETRSTAVVREFLADLRSLCSPLGLVVVARVRGGGCKPLDEVINDLGVVPVKRLLRDYTLQVFGPEDYLSRWRRHWAQCLGVGMIPQTVDELATALACQGRAEASDSVTSEQVARWLKSAGWTDADLAERLNVSRSTVCRYRLGSRRLPNAVGERIASLMKSEGKDREV